MFLFSNFLTSAIINVINFSQCVFEYVKENLSNYNFNIAQISYSWITGACYTELFMKSARLTTRIFVFFCHLTAF